MTIQIAPTAATATATTTATTATRTTTATGTAATPRSYTRALGVLLKESWSQVEDLDELAERTYARLFLADENLRELFPVTMSEQRARFLSALASLMQMVDDPERLDRYLYELGRHHRKFHVLPQHFRLLGGALLASLRHGLGERWSAEYDNAWREAYDLIVTKMLAGLRAAGDTAAFWNAEVVAHRRRSRDVAVFTCAPLRPLPFRAGQYVSLECRHHPRVWRPFWIANAPREDGTLDFHVRAHGDAWVSAALVRRLRVGDFVRIGEPLGTPVLDHFTARDLVFVASGTGIAPVKAMIEELARANRSRWVHVFIGGRERADLYDLRAMGRLAARYSWLSVVAACSDDLSFPGEQGPISEVVQRHGPWPDHDCYVCGSAAMVRATLGSLAQLGVPPGRIKFDTIASR